jgi:hypothetical protein
VDRPRARYRASRPSVRLSISGKPINSEQSALVRGRSVSHAPQRDVPGKNPTESVQLGCYQPCVLKGAVWGVILGRPFPALRGAITLERRFSELDFHSPRPHERRHMIGARVPHLATGA